jgi:hypothetical protein
VVTDIGDPIRVAAVFTGGTVQPVWFDWNGRQVRIRETAFIWRTVEGSAPILHFSVTDGVNLYEICFDREKMGWRIERAEHSSY